MSIKSGCKGVQSGKGTMPSLKRCVEVTIKTVQIGPDRLHKPVTDWLETLPHSSDGLNM